ncbi:MAG: hypothetical protein MUC97_15335 [Bernardetiaceae bacterium]|jgi:hypothetical protein|nr:hypothetical protein [Bernardetiaceae bacterium]
MGKYLAIILCICAWGTQAQQRKDLQLSVGIGPLAQYPAGLGQYPGRNLGVSLTADYFLAERHILSFNAIIGTYFYNQERSSGPMDIHNRARLMVTTALYKYRLVNGSRWNLALGTGLSLATSHRSYEEYLIHPITGPYYLREQTSSIDFAGAAKLEIGRRLGARWSVGLEAGCFFGWWMPRSLDGTHLMPRVSYLLK